jgi:flagellar hook-associated protein 2
MRREQSANATKTTALNEVKSLLSSLKSSLTPLSSTAAIQKKAATFKDTSTTWSATANSDSTPGTYEFKFIQEAKAAKLLGAQNVASQIDPSLDLNLLPIGRTITGGNITINGEIVTIDTTKSLNEIVTDINSKLAATGGAADYNSSNIDKITLSGVKSLGASNDTSNFLQVMGLSGSTSSGTITVSSSRTLSSPNLTSSINTSNLIGANLLTIPDDISINGKTITYNPNLESVQDLINKINNSDAGVTASYDLSSGRFILTNKSGGNVGISVVDGGGGLATVLGLDPSSNPTLDPGQDAIFQINGGGNIHSRTNVFDETAHGIVGLTVTAKFDSTAPQPNPNNTQIVTVGNDIEATKNAINTFIEKYNAVQNAIEKYTKVTVDGTKVSSSVLSGNRELANISRELRSILYVAGLDEDDNQLSGTVKRISDIGVGFSGIENTISITNSSVLNSRLNLNADDVIDYFATAENGLSARLDAMLGRLVDDSYTEPNTNTRITGSFKIQLDSISKQNKSLDKQIEEFERRLESQRALLENSFIAMERAQSGFQQQSAYLAKTFSGNSK